MCSSHLALIEMLEAALIALYEGHAGCKHVQGGGDGGLSKRRHYLRDLGEHEELVFFAYCAYARADTCIQIDVPSAHLSERLRGKRIPAMRQFWENGHPCIYTHIDETRSRNHIVIIWRSFSIYTYIMETKSRKRNRVKTFKRLTCGRRICAKQRRHIPCCLERLIAPLKRGTHPIAHMPRRHLFARVDCPPQRTAKRQHIAPHHVQVPARLREVGGPGSLQERPSLRHDLLRPLFRDVRTVMDGDVGLQEGRGRGLRDELLK